jgi:hypothetical protein
MDHDSFDRLTVAIDRWRDRATRRSTLRLLVGGSVAAAGLTAADADARRRERDICRGIGASCKRDRDCCTDTCLADRCRIPGSQECGNRTCLPGFKCCRGNGSERKCTPRGFPTCCGSFSFADGFRCCRSSDSGQSGACPSNSTCCSNRVGAGCCPQGMKCCDGGCCPDGMICCHHGCCPDGFRCASSGCAIDGTATAGTRRMSKTRPFTDRLEIDEADVIEVAPREGEAAPDAEGD